MLYPDIPRLNIGRQSAVAAKLMKVAGAVGDGGAERKGRRHRQCKSIVGAIGRNTAVSRRGAGRAVRVNCEITGEQVSIVDGNFVDAVLVCPSVQEIQGITTKNHGFIV